MTSQIFLSLLFLYGAYSLKVLPHPQLAQLGTKSFNIENPCDFQIVLTNNHDVPDHIFEITNHFFTNKFKTTHNCSPQFTHHVTLNKWSQQTYHSPIIGVHIEDSTLRVELDAKKEAYQLEITEDGQVSIYTPSYMGYLRALETFTQIIEQKEDQTYQINELPLYIQDQPHFPYRGVMVDTSRHYLEIKTLERTIDSLLINKLNVMHWHITDDESFPLLLKSRPEITRTAAYSDKLVYTHEDVKHIVEYAKKRGVVIIPEIDTPGHTWSWGKSEELKEITLQCGVQYGQFDPTLDLTYQVVEDVFSEFAEIFPEAPFVHFGGDEVEKNCWDKRPSIKQYMTNNNITDYNQLQTLYRKKQKSVWKDKIHSQKQIAYWTNKDINLPVDEDDVIHWWGTTEELQEIKDKKNKIILSNYDLLYLDTGLNNAFGNPYSKFHTWKQIYQTFDPLPQGIQGEVIGGIACLWGETNSDTTHFIKMYSRTSALAERLWNPTQNQREKLSDFVKRLVAIEQRLESQGFPVMPASSQYCSLNVDQCFP